MSPSPIFWPYIEYYKNVVTDADGTFKCIPNTNEELYFNFNKMHLQSGSRYDLENPGVYFGGLHGYEQNVFSTLGTGISEGFVIVFKPNGIQNLFRLSNNEIFGYAIEGENIFRNMSEKIWHELKEVSDIEGKKAKVESFLHCFVNPDFYPPNFVNQILQLIKKERGLLSSGEISKRFKISLRTLERKFIDSIGMSPKEYLQITRLNHALNLIQGNNGYSLTQVSYLSGYYDQSHFIGDIKKICGFPP